MKKHVFLLLPVSLFISSINLAHAKDVQLEELEIQQPIIDMFYKEKWSKLDSLFAEYVNGFPATSNGTQKIILAYIALTDNNTSKKDGGEAEADAWLRANPDSSVATMLKAASYSGKAFFLRGEGAADTVDEDVWPQFNKLIQQEKDYLLKHKKVADKDPMWYQLMISVARNQSDRNLLWQTVNEGSDKYPAYQNIYLDAMEASLPKWGGSPQDIEKVAKLAESKNEKSSGKSYYAYVWYNALSFQPDLMNLLNTHQVISWEDAKQGWKDRYKQYPVETTANHYMSMACLAKDKKAFDEGYSWIKQMSGGMVRNQWLPGVDYNKCVHYLESND